MNATATSEHESDLKKFYDVAAGFGALQMKGRILDWASKHRAELSQELRRSLLEELAK